MATELFRELFPDDILWFLQDMERETIDEVDTLIRQIEVNTDEQPLSSTHQADSASAVRNVIMGLTCDSMLFCGIWDK